MIPTRLSLALVPLSNGFGLGFSRLAQVLQPRRDRNLHGLGCLPFRSPLLRASRLISLRRATEMFQFAHCPPLRLCVQRRVTRHHSGRVAPFGISGLLACMQLPRNVSPVSASFIGLLRQGLHLVLSLACRALPSSRLRDRVATCQGERRVLVACLCFFNSCIRQN
jgi:hypothetical protein